MTPEDQQDGATAEQHPAMQMPGGLPDRRVESVAARHGPAGEDQRHPQRPEDVGLAIGRAGAAGQPPGDPQLTNGRFDVPVLPQHGADGLPRDRGVQRGGAAREHRPGTLQGLVGAGEREREQVFVPVPGRSQFGRHVIDPWPSRVRGQIENATVLAADRRGRPAGPAQPRRPAAIYAPDRLGPARLNMAIFTGAMIYSPASPDVSGSTGEDPICRPTRATEGGIRWTRSSRHST